MKYLAQSEMWRLNQLARAKPHNGHSSPISNGKSRILGAFHQIFPLSIFPDDLIVEELRIIHVKKDGPWIREVISIMATDIACVNSTSGMFFGNVHIQSLTGGPQIYVSNLLSRDVQIIRSLVEGVALASREGLKIEPESNLEAEKSKFLEAGSIHYG